MVDTGNPEHQQIIKEISEELRDIKSIVSNLISFSDNKNASQEVYNLNDLIESLINLIRFNARFQQIKISFDKTNTEFMIQSSRNEMKQVLLNLIKNSFEAMPLGGEIKIRTSVNPSDPGRVIIDLEDNGPGLEEESGDIFLPFYSTKKQKGPNMGLGLSVIYGIITKYGGTIHGANLEPRGCRFTITLPRTPD